MKNTLLSLFSLTLAACSGQYTFDSNINKANFDNYLPASKVKLLTQQEVDELEHKYIGVVEGLSCQSKHNERPPQMNDARNDARLQAARRGANALVIKQCYEVEGDAHCLQAISCFATSYQLMSHE